MRIGRVALLDGRSLAVGLALFIAASAGSTQAQPQPNPGAGNSVQGCSIRLAPPGQVYYRGPLSRGYDVFGEARHQENFEVQVVHRGAACAYVLVLTSTNDPGRPSLQGGGGRLAYEVKDGGGGRDLFTANDQGDVGNRIRGSFRAGDGADPISLYMEIPPGQMAPAGRYDDLVVLRLFSENGGEMTLRDERALGVSVDVPAVIRASIGTAGLRATGQLRSAQVDLGQLVPGLRRTLDFVVQSNANVSVAFTSENHGLKHAASDIVVPYTLTFGGRRVASDGTDAIDIPASIGLVSTQSFDLEVGDVARSGPAGAYADTLTVNISAQ